MFEYKETIAIEMALKKQIEILAEELEQITDEEMREVAAHYLRTHRTALAKVLDLEREYQRKLGLEIE